MHRRFLSIVAPSVRARLWLLFSVVAVPGALLAGWMIFQSHRNERKATEQHLLETVRAFSSLLDAELRERVVIAQNLALSGPVAGNDLAAFRARARQVVMRRDEWVILADDEGRELVNTRWADDTKLPQLEITPELRTALAAKRSFISNLVVSDGDPRYSIFVAVPAKIGGQRPGMICLAMTPTALSATLMRDRLADQAVMAVLDRNNVIVARSRSAETFVGTKVATSIQRAAESVREGVRDSRTLEGNPSIAAFTVSPESGWTTAMAGHKEELFRPAKELLVVTLSVTVLVGIVVLLLGWWVSRATEAVATLVLEKTQAMARGERVEAQLTGISEADAVVASLARASRELAAREQALAEARDEALAASRAKDEFLAALSHELRTPLNPVLLIASEAARDMSYPADVRQLFAAIEKNVLQEARLIDDLLDVTRIAAGKLSLQFQLVGFDATVAEAVEALRARAAEKKLEVRVRFSTEGVQVRGDGVRLHQVLTNLLGNAVKFTPERGIILVTTRLDRERRLVTAEIADSGIGMSAEEVARVFERFAQGDHARDASRSRYGGLGLGLAISRSLVELHGGGIAATSAGPGKGSVFTIWLPLAPEGAKRA